MTWHSIGKSHEKSLSNFFWPNFNLSLDDYQANEEPPMLVAADENAQAKIFASSRKAIRVIMAAVRFFSKK